MHKITLIATEKFDDSRGYLSSLWRNSKLNLHFLEDRLSVSSKNVLRGLHGDKTTGKLFIPISGRYTFYAKSLVNSDLMFIKDFSADDNVAIYVPPNYINGHLCKSDNCVMLYKWTREYMGPDVQFTVKYDDPELGIDWGIDNPIISTRDQNGISYSELIKQQGY